MITLPTYLIFVIPIALSFIFGEIDVQVLKKRYIYDHTSRAILRGLIFLAFSAYQHYQLPPPEAYLLITVGALLQACIFWVVFDIYLNLRRGLGVFYLGSVATSDKVFKEPWYQIAAKVFMNVVSIGIYTSMVQI